jgi:hypothetical protein
LLGTGVYMKEVTYSSPEIAKEIRKRYGSSAKVVHFDMRHEEEVRKYVLKIEEAHKKAASSNLRFD